MFDSYRDVQAMQNFKWHEIEQEFRLHFPEVHALCSAIATPPSQSGKDITGRLALIYALLMQSRCSEMSLIQHVISAVLLDSNVHQKVMHSS